MTVRPLLTEPSRVDEPREAQGFSDVLSQVASQRQPVIVRRNGKDLAALVPLEHLEILREVLSSQEAEELAAGIDWEKAVADLQPSQAWFDGDEPKPF